MEKGIKIQVTLAQEVAKKLDLYCQKMGIKRSAAISLALSELWKEESFDEK